ncbi:MAG: ATPase [Candidatus Handelsmanbacteria bacterium RIFCSPLOWO2_12_FULL_64_10]|uniref:ATPase n=1 Tax=Handelsmanbacteria sp. (strain RIFCSPLOWO2_12_FULL_64_10) TaxID=1817868 RepID=A0A1F6CYW7_HANXR|nr:MAG: ATPase [Candidatus Handelsmanbacteria bacterium RIFCSPLOWO2_12_FULL_64_10]
MIAINEQVNRESVFVEAILAEVGRVIVGQQYMVERLLIALLCNGHVLLEGVPGLAKTLSVNTLARTIRASFHRIQFTPDLLPADLIGTMIYHQGNGEFVPKKGPIFAHLILADEVNRAPAKVQSAMLEAMQERQVTIGDRSFPLEDPFLVLATQNPIEQEGTYPLPEAQLDRFMLKVRVTYPSRKEERAIMDRMSGGPPPQVRPVVTPADIVKARAVVNAVYVDEKIKDYIVDLVFATRDPAGSGLGDLASMIEYGASPRASIYLTQAARAHAFLQRRGYVTPEDVKAVGLDVLRHRVIVTYEAEAEEITAEDVVRRVFDHVEVP